MNNYGQSAQEFFDGTINIDMDSPPSILTKYGLILLEASELLLSKNKPTHSATNP